MPPLLSPEIGLRNEFGDLLNRRRLGGHAVEIGTDRAGFAVMLLNRWRGHELICIDPWEDDLDGYGQMLWPREPDYLMAMAALSRFNNRVRIFRGTAQQYVNKQKIRWPFTFVYVDGNHLYEHVREEIELFWPHVAENGILAGHDYVEAMPGVIRAVDEFAKREQRQVWLTHEPGHKSWYIYKTLPEDLACVMKAQS